MNRVEFYNSPEELPIKRFQKFNKNVMIDVEVGNSFQDYEERTFKTVAFLRKGMLEDAIKELENRRQAVFNAFEEYSPKHYALALMVKSIDGEPCEDMSEEGLNLILEKLDKINYSEKELNEDLAKVKKKSTIFSKCTFPATLKTTIKKTLISFLNNY